jgi:hypothetical protein
MDPEAIITNIANILYWKSGTVVNSLHTLKGHKELGVLSQLILPEAL